ncbi:hypothetical protein CGQ24_09270 [Arthrobacter sp. 7749]|nr:hypothetical protein CGQ24_09270 [Arthrobacter sp. 7749]
MGNLQAAHLGYEYQDLISALALVDLLWDHELEATVDTKLVEDDRFDDLTLNKAGVRHRTQFKHSASPSPLSLETFTQDSRSLKLNMLVKCAVADRDRYGDGVDDYFFRIFMRDTPPTDQILATVLKPENSHASLSAGLRTRRFRFDVEAIWPLPGKPQGHKRFSFLRKGSSAVSREDLAWFCSRTVLELEAPAFNSSLIAPGDAERLLLSRMREEVGVGLYPNEHRLAEDAAAAFLTVVRAARQGQGKVSRMELLRAAQLRQDYGAVAREFPVDQSIAVHRDDAVESLFEVVTDTARSGGCVLVTGPPGHGKSYLSQQLVETLSGEGWLVGEHYCFLNQGASDPSIRVDVNVMMGSLLARLAEASPDLAGDQRPFLAATAATLEGALGLLATGRVKRKVALVIDGLDHVSRVLGQHRQSNPSRELAAVLASLKMPPGTVLVVLSQPGDFLEPLELPTSQTFEMPGLTRLETETLAGNLGVEASCRPQTMQVIETLHQLSGGNGLYATYLCKELLAVGTPAGDEESKLRNLPPFDGSLHGYYSHLYESLDALGGGVADLLAVLAFSVTRSEICEIDPALTHRVDAALTALKPVLLEVAAQGGVRVYHESFGRYLLARFEEHPTVLQSLHGKVADWLSGRGMVKDLRAFGFLVPALMAAGRSAEVPQLMSADFVAAAVAAGHSPTQIAKNLLLGVESAGDHNDWPSVIRCVELVQSVNAFEFERFDTLLVDFADVALACVGTEALVERLLHGNQPQTTGRSGLLLCAAIDLAGGNPPWRQYMLAFDNEKESDNTSYGADSEREVRQAWLLGRLRLGSTADGDVSQPEGVPIEPESPVSLDLLGKHLDEFDFDEKFVAGALLTSFGLERVKELILKLSRPGDYALAIAEIMAVKANAQAATDYIAWVKTAVAFGVRRGNVARLLRLGATVGELKDGFENFQTELNALSHKILSSGYHVDSQDVARWMDLCDYGAAMGSPNLRPSVDAKLRTDGGWYHSFLSFYVQRAQAEFDLAEGRSSRILTALETLAQEENPFRGSPRACDLYRIHGLIKSTIVNAVYLLNDEHWIPALKSLEATCQNTSKSFKGMTNGPVTVELVLEVACSRSRVAFDEVGPLLERLGESALARSTYSEIASYYLFLARFHLRAGDQAEALEMWRQAAALMTSYGGRRDITIFELLGPLEALAEVDARSALDALSRAQSLCERVLMHTDGKDTRHCMETWWEALVRIEPVSGAELLANDLLADFNLPHYTLEAARSELWRSTVMQADMVLSSALRLSLEIGLDKSDVTLHQRLQTEADLSLQPFVTLLLSRLEERTTDYTYTNAEEMMANDMSLVRQIVAAAGPTAPKLSPFPSGLERSRPQSPSWKRPNDTGDGRSAKESIESKILVSTTNDLDGITQLANILNGLDSSQLAAETPRMRNLIGYRLIEIIQNGTGDLADAIKAVANALRYQKTTLLGEIAEGLARHGQNEAAAMAASFAWTRARSGGGWLMFGGLQEVEWLTLAFEQSPQTSKSVILSEITELLATGRGSYGITQALIIALATVPTLENQSDNTHVAIRSWQAAAEVIEVRMPRFSRADDPDFPFTVPESERQSQNLESCFDTALVRGTIAGLASPFREQKRRTLLALQLALQLRPSLVGPAFSDALLVIKDPASLVWLLSLLASAASDEPRVRCQDALAELCKSEFLTVRVLARQLMLSDAELPPAVPRHPSIALGSRLWLPSDSPVTAEGLEMLEERVAYQVGARLQAAEEILPGIGDAVIATLGEHKLKEQIRSKASRQARILGIRSDDSLPDVWMAMDEEIERTMQVIASSARGTYIERGISFQDRSLESTLATTLNDDPMLPILVEMTRHPRIENNENAGSGESGMGCSAKERRHSFRYFGHG